MNFVIISYSRLPNGDAGSVRQITLAKLLTFIDHKVKCVGMGKTPDNEVFEGISISSLRINKKGLLGKLKNYFGYKKRVIFYLKQLHNREKIDFIIVVDIPVNALKSVKRFAKEKRIKLIHDSVEWYSKEQFNTGIVSPSYVLKNLYNKYYINKQFNVIAISSYLEKHFKNRGLNTIRIPVIMDVLSISCKKSSKNSKLKILYAGSPGKKDYFNEIINGIAMLDNKELKKIELIILGITENKFIKNNIRNNSSINKIKQSVKFIGRVSREEVKKFLEETDFTILIRSPTLRYAKAGFPTKVVESLTSATPIICNISSDLGDYIVDNENGIIVEECSAEALYKALKKAMQLNVKQKEFMKRKARESAEKYFDYRLYGEELTKLFS